MSWFIYMLRCGNGDVYTGMTTDIACRLGEHQSKTGGRFTKLSQPVQIVYQECFENREEARRREVQLKAWSRRKKLALVAHDTLALKQA